jgi:hypothetical protein
MSKKFKPYFTATIKKIDGVSSMIWDTGEEKKVKTWLGALQWKTVDTKIKVTLERYRDDVSTKQLKYLFGVVYPIIADYAGIDIYEYGREIHTPLKIMFLGYRDTEQKKEFKIFGNGLKFSENKFKLVELVSISDLNTKETSDFIENVRRYFLKEHNLHIPVPNEVDFEELPETIPEF